MDEVYKKLNSYLNDWFVRVEKEEPVFIENLYNVFLVTNSICKRKIDTDIFQKVNNPKMDSLTSISYARKIIESIDYEMLEKFDVVLSSGILNINEEFYKKDSSYYAAVYNEENILLREQIELQLDYTTDDIRKIVHEFIHLYYNVPNRSQNYIFLIEFFSIYFEEYARNFMEKYNDESLRISSISRINRFLQSVNFIQHFIIVFITYKNLGDLSNKSQIELKEICHINYNSFEQKCYESLELFESENNNIANAYKYIVGTILAYYCIDKVDVKIVLNFGKNINKETYCNLNIFELLQTININLDSNLINETIGKIENELNLTKLKKIK